MNPASGALLSLAYILGLLSTASLRLLFDTASWKECAVLGIGVGILWLVAAIAVPRFWKTAPKPRLWLMAGIVAALAPLYFHSRVPQPASNDISQFVRANSTIQEQIVTIQGKVETVPRLTRSSRGQFWLEAMQLNEVESSDNKGGTSKEVTGKLYVTVPLLQATGLYPDETIAVTGVLYKPKPVLNPGAFDFGAYLAKEGAFAGFSGRQVTELDEQQKHRWGWWVLRQRITRSLVHWLGSPVGPVVSSIVLGNQAIDIPYDIRDQFVHAGLAHALAASGFQISLILSWVLGLTKRFSVKAQLCFGTGALLIFVGLTGLQPSVLRAAVMGFGALVALFTKRKVKPLGSLFVAATLLLLFNPLWIWDLGFELSFLATLGLLVTVPPLTKQFDWLPPAIASLITVPLAATLWTLPLQLYVFGMVAPYSLAANIFSAPLISVISIAGVISAVAAVISPLAGSAFAWLLYHPTQLLIAVVQFFNNLPGSSTAVGTISVVQLLLLYGLIGIGCISSRVRRRWLLVAMLAVSLVMLPVWQTKIAQFKVTMLATAQEQVLVIQDRGQVALVNSGEADTASFTVLPFLQQQGVNQIDYALALDSKSRLRGGWLQLLASLPIKTFYDNADAHSSTEAQSNNATASSSDIAGTVSQQGKYQQLSTGQTISVGSTPVELINAEPPVLKLQIRDQTWLLLGEIKPDRQTQLAKSASLPKAQVLCWSGDGLASELLEALQPKVAIASSNKVDSEAAQLLRKSKIPLYWTGRDGAVQWTPKGGFETTLEATNNDAPLL